MSSPGNILRSAIHAAKMPFCATGGVPISRDNPITLFFEGPDADTDAKSVRFPPSSPGDMKPLLDVCKQASFGRGEEEVIDPSYRRALVLHGSSFGIAPASAVDPHKLGILSKIRHTLLSGTGASAADLDEYAKENSVKDRRVIAQLDKLNVYSAGDFFKGHVDTPRSTNMFGTLLINLPVAHEGGQLIVHSPYGHYYEDSDDVAQYSDAGLGKRDSFTVEWGAEDVLGWIAFFSDCPHEILPVKSGNRVTLSYNLFFEETSLCPTVGGDAVQERAVERIVDALKLPGNFDDSQPFVAFHLQHAYPVRLHDEKASAVVPCLKAGDALIYRALRQVGAHITFHYYYRGDDRKDYVLSEDSQVPSHTVVDEEIQGNFNGRRLHRLGVYTALEAPPVGDEEDDDDDEAEWTERCFTTATKFMYVAHGNEATLGVQYASICMIASAPGHNIVDGWGSHYDDW